ncbi:hypothetical protein NSS79_10590 [Paenibacillus sp. FSL L8-0436]|uniref:hypothetical protein n=1 Tax=Paenibacillus sp. FSL L8-0436 TaxID=2954686 RepID=UPI0031595AFA
MYDYKTEFHDAVTGLIAQDITDRAERMAAIHALTDAYFDSVGKQPDAAEVERLTDYILREELTDTDRMKTRNTEYPFLSEHQFARRQGGEASDKAAEEYGVDGRNYGAPGRRKRSKGEGMLVDQYAKIRNKTRAAQYKRDTAPGPEITYNLYETGGELTEPFTQKRGIGARWLTDMSAVNEVTVEPAEEHVREAA